MLDVQVIAKVVEYHVKPAINLNQVKERKAKAVGTLCNNLAEVFCEELSFTYFAEGIFSRASISTNPFYDMMSLRYEMYRM